jgi:hypothetical protein
MLVLKVRIKKNKENTPISIIIKKKENMAHVGIEPTPYKKPS